MLVVPTDCANLYQALHQATEGEIILVQEGTHVLPEPLDIYKSVSIVGDGEKEKVILTFESTGAVVVNAPKVRLSKLTIQLVNARFAQDAIEAGTGELAIQHCRIEGGENGVRAFLGARVVITSSEVCQAAQHGINIETKARVELRDSFVHDCKLNGVLVTGASTSSIAFDVEVFNVGRNGIECSRCGSMEAFQCKLHGVTENGFLVLGKGSGCVADDCVITDCGGYGISVQEGAQSRVEACKMQRNRMGDIQKDEISTVKTEKMSEASIRLL